MVATAALFKYACPEFTLATGRMHRKKSSGLGSYFSLIYNFLVRKVRLKIKKKRNLALTGAEYVFFLE